MEKAKHGLFQEDEYLEELVFEGIDVKVYLINGVCLTGNIIDFGKSSILLSNTGSRSRGANQLIYKHAMTSIIESPQGNNGWNYE